MAVPDIDTLFKAFDELADPVTTEPVRTNGDECANCGSYDSKIRGACTNCGLCESVDIHQGAEWVSGVDETGVAHDPCRVGMPSDPLFSTSWGKTCMIKTDWKTRQKYGFIARLNFHGGMNHRDRALWKSYNEFDTVGKENLNLSHAIVTAAKGTIRGSRNLSLPAVLCVRVSRRIVCFGLVRTIMFPGRPRRLQRRSIFLRRIFPVHLIMPEMSSSPRVTELPNRLIWFQEYSEPLTSTWTVVLTEYPRSARRPPQ